jgi:hypothetical protein
MQPLNMTAETAVHAALQAIHGAEGPELEPNHPAGLTYDQVFAVTREQPLDVVDPLHPGPGDAALVEAAGCDAEHIERMRQLQRTRRPWQAAASICTPDYGSRPKSRLFEILSKSDVDFAVGLSRGEPMLAICPFSGREVSSRHGFCIYEAGLIYYIYRFKSTEIFYICSLTPFNLKFFAYMPRRRLAVFLDYMGWRPVDIRTLTAQLDARLVCAGPKAGAYLRAETSAALVINSNNFGHYFWNVFSGLHHLVDRGLAPTVADRIEVGPLFAEVETAFHELVHQRVLRTNDPAEVFNYCLENSLVPTAVVEGVIGAAFALRMRGAAERGGAPKNAPPIGRKFPLIWINLRAHRKVWLSQAEGYAAILNALKQDYPDLAVFIDGMADCKAIAADLKARLDPSIKVHDGLEFGAYDTLRWAFAIDAYICPIGSSLALVTWLAASRGVTHAERFHMTQQEWWNDIRADAPSPVFPAMEDITDIGGGMYCNYEVDWRLLLGLMRKVLIDLRPPQARTPWEAIRRWAGKRVQAQRLLAK